MRELVVVGLLSLGFLLACAVVPAEEHWSLVQGLEECAVSRLEGSPARFAAPWRSCGEECRERAAVPSALLGFVAEPSASAAQVSGGALYLRTTLAGREHRYEIISRGEEAEPLLVLRMSSACRVAHKKAHAALLVELFRDPRAHRAAIFDPASRRLEVHPSAIDVEAPIAGWFVSGDAFGVADARGVRVMQGGKTKIIGGAGERRVDPQILAGGSVAWIDWDREELIEWTADQEISKRAERTIAFAAAPNGDLAWIDSAGRVSWSGGSLDLSGKLGGAVSMVLDRRTLAITATGDGDAMAPALFQISRRTGVLETIAPPVGNWEVAAAYRGRAVVQESSDDAQLARWIIISESS